MKDHEMYKIWDIGTEYEKKRLIHYLHCGRDDPDEAEMTLFSTVPSYRILDDILNRLEKFSVVIEELYVDKVYRNSYYRYYSAKHFDFERQCKRVTLFSECLESSEITFHQRRPEELQKSFLGSIVIRPVPGHIVGRTLLNPEYFFDRTQIGYIRLAEFEITVLGKKLTVQAFPYSMQDGETTSCAETSLLNLLEYYCQSYPEYRSFLPGDISDIVSHHSHERVFPTKGLTFEMISRVLCEAGFNPVLYSVQNMGMNLIRRLICNYIESAIPMILGVNTPKNQAHAIVVIGHVLSSSDSNQCVTTSLTDDGRNFSVCDTSDMIDTFIVMDDNVAPYKVMKLSVIHDRENRKKLMLGDYEVKTVIVPLYKRMILEAVNAFEICMNTLTNRPLNIETLTKENTELIRNRFDIDPESLGTEENPYVVRLFMASSKTYSRVRDSHFLKDNSTNTQFVYSTVYFPKFVWVCEISTKQLYPERILGEIVIDATSSPESKLESFILIHYPFVFAENNIFYDYSVRMSTYEDPEWKPYRLFNGNLKGFHENKCEQ